MLLRAQIYYLVEYDEGFIFNTLMQLRIRLWHKKWDAAAHFAKSVRWPLNSKFLIAVGLNPAQTKHVRQVFLLSANRADKSGYHVSNL